MHARKRPRAPLQVVTHQLPPAVAQVVECPVCGRALSLAALEVHLDSCLSKSGGAGTAAGTAQQPGGGVQRTLAQASGFVALPRGVKAPFSASPAKARASTAPQPPPGLAPPPDRELDFQVDAPVETALGAAVAEAEAPWAHPQLSSPPPHTPQAGCLPDPVDDDDKAGDDAARDCSLEPAVLATFVAGRHAHKAAAPALAPGAAVTLVREPDNAVDADALKVVTLCGACLGYVPAAIAAELSPLVHAGLLQLHATLPCGAVAGADAPSGDAPAMHITATFDAGSALSPGAQRSAGMAWHAAAAAAAATLPGGAARTASAVRNMRALVSTVVASASHLFTAEQTAVMDAFTCASSLSDAASSLLVHMLLRKGPWFKLAALHYAGIDDSLAAVKELQTAGLAHVLDPSALDTCITAVLACVRSEADAALDLCQLLTPAEARAAVATAQLVTPPSAAARMSRSDAVAALARGLARGDDVEEDDTAHGAASAWVAAVACGKAVVRLTPLAASALARAQRLFFLGCGGSASASATLDVSRFLLVDLGVVRYPRVMGAPQPPADGCMWTHLFPSLAHLERFEEAVSCEADVETALEARDDGAAMRACERSLRALGWHQGGDAACAAGHAAPADEQHSMRAPFLAQFTASHIHAGCVIVAITLHERARDYTAAVALLRRMLSSTHRPGGRGKLWVRLATDLEHLRLYDDALDACEAGLADAWTRRGQAHELRAKAVRIAKPPRRWKPPTWAVSAPHLQPPRVVTVPQPTPLRSERSKKSLFAADDEGAIEPADGKAAHWTVEQLALAHYRSAGWPCGVHSESQVWTTLFGLFFWDILFDANTAPPGAFLGSSFQTAPLDLHSLHFAAWPPRAAALRGRLQSIATGGSDAARALLSAAWTAHKGTSCAGVAWSAFSLEQLQEIASCIGGAKLAAIMRLLALDYAGWRGGMPDLVLWRPQLQPDDPPSAALLVEVKGLNDALRSNQRAWCDALAQAGVDIEVLHFV